MEAEADALPDEDEHGNPVQMDEDHPAASEDLPPPSSNKASALVSTPVKPVDRAPSLDMNHINNKMQEAKQKAVLLKRSGKQQEALQALKIVKSLQQRISELQVWGAILLCVFGLTLGGCVCVFQSVLIQSFSSLDTEWRQWGYAIKHSQRNRAQLCVH